MLDSRDGTTWKYIPLMPGGGWTLLEFTDAETNTKGTWQEPQDRVVSQVTQAL